MVKLIVMWKHLKIKNSSSTSPDEFWVFPEITTVSLAVPSKEYVAGISLMPGGFIVLDTCGLSDKLTFSRLSNS